MRRVYHSGKSKILAILRYVNHFIWAKFKSIGRKRPQEETEETVGEAFAYLGNIEIDKTVYEYAPNLGPNAPIEDFNNNPPLHLTEALHGQSLASLPTSKGAGAPILCFCVKTEGRCPLMKTLRD